MANKRGTDGHTNFGGGFLFSQGAGGLWDLLDHFQAGKLYLTTLNATTASGTFEKAWTEATDPNNVAITMRVNPSGNYWVSSMDNTGFVVTFKVSPYAGSVGALPLYIADWFACM